MSSNKSSWIYLNSIRASKVVVGFLKPIVRKEDGSEDIGQIIQTN